MKMIKTIGLTFAAAALMASTAQALPISGEIQFFGTATLDAAPSAATSITFINPATVTLADGSYSGLAGEDATFTDFVFGAVGTTGANNVDPLWAVIGDWEFALTSITINQLVGSQRNLEGNGLARGPAGFEETPGHWTLSTSGSGTTITFSSATTAVPDAGTTMILLGAALSGLGLIRRRMIA